MLRAARYLLRFRCLGAECPDNCCQGWRVIVDERHHELLRGRLDPAELAARLRRIPDGDRQRFALTVLDEQGRCSFLDGAGLCSVHARFGEDHLPDGCATFPRIAGRVGRDHEAVATLSCPEVSRLVFDEAAGDAFELVPAGRADFGRGLVHQRIEPAEEADFLAVRARLAELLGLAPYPLASRLFFMAGAATEAQGKAADPEALHRALAPFAPANPFALSVVRQLLGLPTRMMPRALRALMAELPAEDDAAYRKRPRPPELDGWLERVARHHLQREFFTRSPSLTSYVLFLLARLALLRYLVTSHPHPTLATFIRAVTGVTRLLEHDRPLAEAFAAELSGHAGEALEAAAALARF